MVEPRGDKDFGYGASFLPENSSLTFGELEREEKYKIDARGKASSALKEYLLNHAKS